MCISLRMDWLYGWADTEKLHLPAEDRRPAVPPQISAWGICQWRQVAVLLKAEKQFKSRKVEEI